MKKFILSGLACLTLATSVPVLAQGASWDRERFWQGVSADPLARIDVMQRRIDRGVSDGSLTRKEARNSQQSLNKIRRDARRMGRIDNREASILNSRLDNLAQKIRLRRTDDDYANGMSRADYDRRFATDYDAARYYRDDPRYTERRLTSDDQVYRGSDGRYYCKRSDGTTGLIAGAAAGGLLGNVIDGGGNRLAGTLIGGALGALAGKSIDQSSDVRCR
jgi:hypothetical protein